MNAPDPNRAALRHSAARVLGWFEARRERFTDTGVPLPVAQIANFAGVSEKSARRALLVLEERRFIRAEYKPGRSGGIVVNLATY